MAADGGRHYAVPLTTAFTIPLGCRYPLEDPDLGRCQPDQFPVLWYGDGFYSPGICPSGYTIGCTAGKSSTPVLNGVVVEAEETAAICVPR